VRSRERGVALPRDIEIPGTAEVVLGTGAADRGMVAIAVEVHLQFALTPPARAVHTPGEVGPHELAVPLHASEDGVRPALVQGVAAPPLRVQSARSGAGGTLTFLIGDLVVHDHGLVAEVFHTQPRAATE